MEAMISFGIQFNGNGNWNTICYNHALHFERAMWTLVKSVELPFLFVLNLWIPVQMLKLAQMHVKTQVFSSHRLNFTREFTQSIDSAIILLQIGWFYG